MLTYRKNAYKTAELIKWSSIKKNKRPIVKDTIETIGVDISNTRFTDVDDLNAWFIYDYKLDQLVNEFWGLETKSRLLAVTREIDDKAWHGLVSEWDSETRQSGEFRLNKDLIKNLLSFSLGTKQKDFKLQNITELEFAIFENFFVELENYWKDYWRVGIPSSKGTFSYLIWIIDFDDENFGSLAISVPPGIYPQQELHKEPADVFAVANELKLEVPLDLTLGKTKLKISEVKELEAGDLLIFEDSNTGLAYWEKNEFEKLNITLSLPNREDPQYAMYYLNPLEIENMNEENLSDDLLTDLPVEVTAQFKSVSMPINKIAELEQGDVLPLGLLMESPLTLMAPGEKALAQGNLVIVGNQFALRIAKTGIKAGKAPKAKLKAEAAPAVTQAPQAQYGHVPEAMDVDPNMQAAMEAMTPEQMQQLQQQQMMMQQQQAAAGQMPNHDQQVDQELQDMGIDPKELDELEDLY